MLRVGFLGLVLLATAANGGCSGKTADADTGTAVIKGAGSTFVAPLMRRWCEKYHVQHPDVAIEYQPVGSGEGAKHFLAGDLDFGASDAALTDGEIASAKDGAVLVPVTAGSIVLAYSPDGLPHDLKLSRSVYADIFLGKITRWDDERIAALNPDASLPTRDISLVVRQDSSGTTFAFTKHLSAVSEEWRNKPGEAKNVDWPSHPIRENGNEGVAGAIKRTPASMGYLEYGIAKAAGLKMAWLQNKSGNYIKPGGNSGLETLLTTEMPSNLRVFMPDPEGKESYPIVTYSWLLLHGKYDDPKKLATIKDFVLWCLDDGQHDSESLGYIRLAPHVVSLTNKALESVAQR
jgi:phosphate transport system substrate-binding protein